MDYLNLKKWMPKYDVFTWMLILLWTFEVFIVQSVCLKVSVWHGINYHTSRFVLDFITSLLLCTFLPALLLDLFFVLSLILSIVLVSYYFEFHSPLFWSSFSSQINEGLALVSYGFKLVDPMSTVLLFLALLFKVYLNHNREINVEAKNKQIGFVGIAIILLCLMWQNNHRGPFIEKLQNYNQYGLVKFYGHLVTWLSESLVLDAESLLKSFPERNLANQITLLDGPPPQSDNIVIIQVESLDYFLLNNKENGKKTITPFLDSILNRSRVYKVFAPHILGSASTDFMTLMQRPRSKTVLAYSLANYDYSSESKLHTLAARKGYNFSTLHGFTGGFFFREYAYKRMGVPHVYFAEDIPKEGKTLTPCLDDFGFLDEDTFSFALELIKGSSNEKQVLFVITLTSHTPFDLLPKEKWKYYPKADSKYKRFVNSIHYTDACLQSFVSQLSEDTVVLIYGDHNSGMKFAKKTDGYVPFIVYQKDRDLSLDNKKQKFRLSGEITLESVAENIGSIFYN